MTDVDLDKETARAVAALVYRLDNRGDADNEWIAREFMAALRGQGWRPAMARPLPDWHYRSHGELPDASKPGGADYLAERTRLFGRPADADADDGDPS